jgi:hypothetical protein
MPFLILIEWSMSAKFTIDIIADEVKLYDKSSNFIWSDDSIAEFQAALLSPDIQKKIENFKNKVVSLLLRHRICLSTV